MQSIQDQQNHLLGAVLPLVPLIQSVPSQIDQIKSTLSDMVSGAISSMTKSIDGIKTTLVSSGLSHGQEGRFVRSSTQAPSLYKTASSSLRKRSNSTAHNSSDGPQEINVTFSSPLAGRDQVLRLPSSKRLRLDASTHCVVPPHLFRQLSRSAWPPPSIGSVQRRSEVVDLTAIPRTPRTPRQPLADLIPPSDPSKNRTPRTMQNIPGSTSRLSVGYMRPEVAPQPSGATSHPTVTQNSISGPLLPWIPAQQARNDVQDSVINQRRSVSPVRSIDLPSASNAAPNSSSVPGPLSEDVIAKAIKAEEVSQPTLTGVFSIPSSPLSPVPSQTTPQLYPNPDTTSTSTGIIQPPTQQQSQAHPGGISGLASRTRRCPREVVQIPQTFSNPLSSKPDTSPLKSMSLRDRRAQMSMLGRTATRRFISLVPWSDEE
ncbi:hypothetical protein BS17DRAFT_379019 [Gyrodon lividus]|nr:hypothetical protein BS17DRAFT_379019 [Gyrodon lividus]